MQTGQHVSDVQGYGVELPVHRPPHVPTGRASAGLGSDQVSITAFHLSLDITTSSAFLSLVYHAHVHCLPDLLLASPNARLVAFVHGQVRAHFT